MYMLWTVESVLPIFFLHLPPGRLDTENVCPRSLWNCGVLLVSYRWVFQLLVTLLYEWNDETLSKRKSCHV